MGGGRGETGRGWLCTSYATVEMYGVGRPHTHVDSN